MENPLYKNNSIKVDHQGKLTLGSFETLYIYIINFSMFKYCCIPFKSRKQKYCKQIIDQANLKLDQDLDYFNLV